MNIAVTAPTGHIGSAVANYLLESGGVRVKLLGRRPEKLRGFINRGAEVGIGTQDDAEYLIRETKGIDALFWLTPPGYGSDNPRAFQNRLGKAAATAIHSNQIPRVVNLSSVGADLESGAGPVSGLHDVERLLNEAAENITHLRPGFFFENLFMQLDTIRKWGRISLPLSGSTRYPMLATRDIGRVAADRLLDASWTGQSIRELHGPIDMSYTEAAEILTGALGRKIVFVRCDREEACQQLISLGMSESAAAEIMEMYEAIESGKMKTLVPRSPDTTTPTTLAEFAHEVLLPQLAVPTVQ